MTRLTFDTAAVRALADHALKAPKHGMGWTPEGEIAPTPKPCLILVKDDGIYLMSNGDPGLPIGGNCVYAKGYNPKTDGDVWQKCSDAVGGDDFSEYLPIDDFAIVLSDRNDTDNFQINVGASSISISCLVKKELSKRRAEIIGIIARLQAAAPNHSMCSSGSPGRRKPRWRPPSGRR